MNKVIEVSNLSKTFYVGDYSSSTLSKIGKLFTKGNPVNALKDLNFDIQQGDFFGVIGRNGSGKSTLLKILLGAMEADKGGKIFRKGKMIRMALGMGFDPNLTAKDNIYLNGTILGMTFKSIGLKFDEIIDFAGLEGFVDTPIRFYSSGMKSRLAFAVAINADADIFLMDEFFGGVGDEEFKKKSGDAFKENLVNGKTIVLVSHNLNLVKANCNKVLILNKGIQHGVLSPNKAIVKYMELYEESKLEAKSV